MSKNILTLTINEDGEVRIWENEKSIEIWYKIDGMTTFMDNRNMNPFNPPYLPPVPISIEEMKKKIKKFKLPNETP